LISDGAFDAALDADLPVSVPLLVLVRCGEEVDRLVGAVPERQLRQWLEPHLTPAESTQGS
jgi:thioredoxin-like negative regulator of GroEL